MPSGGGVRPRGGQPIERGAVILGLTLSEACGEDPGVACRRVYNWTNNPTLSDLAEWLVDKPLRIALILVTAWILTRVARRLIGRSVRRLVESTRDGRLGRISGSSMVGTA